MILNSQDNAAAVRAASPFLEDAAVPAALLLPLLRQHRIRFIN